MQIVYLIVSAIRLWIDFLCVVYAKIFWPDEKGRLAPVKDDVLLKPAREIALLIKRGKIKSENVVRAYVKRVKEVNPLINSIVDERYEDAIYEAKAIDARVEDELNGHSSPHGLPPTGDLPLLGVPFTVKDSVGLKGLRITNGFYAFKDQRADNDAAVVSNLRKAGAIPIAITNVPCGLTWFTTENAAFGRTNNPYDLSRIPGGSSGGECALISAAGSLIGVGSDIAGSIRIPAHCCGIWGHKTTSGVISRSGLMEKMSKKESHAFSLGPLTRYACDLLPMLKAMVGSDISKMTRIDETVDFTKVKIFYMFDDMDPFKTRTAEKTKAAILNVAHHFEKNFGAKVFPVTFTDFAETSAMLIACIQDAKGVPFFAQLTGLMSPSEAVIKLLTELFKSLFNRSEYTRHAIVFALLEIVTPANSAFVEKNLKLRDELEEEIKKMLEPNGVLILPTVPEGAFKHGTTFFKWQNVNYCSIFNLLGLPSTQCPIGLGVDGMPLGIQVAANPFNDHLTIAVAQEVDRLFGGWIPPFAKEI